MQIVIDIPKDIIYDIKESYMGEDVLYCGVKYGTPLPKGHGRLIDADKFIEDGCQEFCGCSLNECPFKTYCLDTRSILKAPTVEAVPMSVIEDIKVEIGWMNSAAYMGEYNKGLQDALKVIDKHISGKEKQ